MHQDIRRGLYGLVFAAGLAALGSSEASAAEAPGQDGLLAGNRIAPAITIPVTAEGTPIALVGTGGTGGTGATVRPGSTTPAADGAPADHGTPGSTGS